MSKVEESGGAVAALIGLMDTTCLDALSADAKTRDVARALAKKLGQLLCDSSIDPLFSNNEYARKQLPDLSLMMREFTSGRVHIGSATEILRAIFTRFLERASARSGSPNRRLLTAIAGGYDERFTSNPVLLYMRRTFRNILRSLRITKEDTKGMPNVHQLALDLDLDEEAPDPKRELEAYEMYLHAVYLATTPSPVTPAKTVRKRQSPMRKAVGRPSAGKKQRTRK